MVSIQRKAATRTMIDTIRQTELMPVPTLRAVLRHISWIHIDHPTAGTFCLACQKVKELSPCHVGNTLIDAAKVVFLHIVDGKVFNGYGVESIHKFSGFLMSKVFTLPDNALMHTSNYPSRFCAKFRTLGLFRKLTLNFSQGFLFLLEKSRILNFLSVRQGGKRFEPQINTDSGFNWLFCWNMINDAGKRDIPFSGWRPANSTGFNGAIYGTMKFYFDISDIGKLQGAVEPLKSDLRISERIVPELASKTGIAGFITGLDTPEESTEGKINSGGNILKRLAESIVQKIVFFFKLRNGLGLLVSGKTFLFGFPRSLTLFEEMVIEKTAGIKAFLKLFCLSSVWENPVFVGFSHAGYTVYQDLHNVNTYFKGVGAPPWGKPAGYSCRI